MTPSLRARQGVENGRPNIGAFRTERDRLQDVLAETNAAVEVYLDLVADGVDDAAATC